MSEVAEQAESTQNPTATRIGIRGMHCAACVAKVEQALSQTPGVVRASVNLASEEALVEYLPGQVSLSGLGTAVASTGFEMVERGENVEEEIERQHRDDYLLLKRKLIVSAVLTVMILVGSYDSAAVFPAVRCSGVVIRPYLSCPVLGRRTVLSKRLGQGTARFQRYEYPDRGWDLSGLSLQYGGGVCSRFFCGSRTTAPDVF